MYTYASRRERGRGSGGYPPSLSPAIARTLGVEEVLIGHTGCVNRISWNASGTLLASGSDDLNVIIRRYPNEGRAGIVLRTAHTANIFGVKFLPCTGDSQIVTGAMDGTVQHHVLERSAAEYPTPVMPPPPPPPMGGLPSEGFAAPSTSTTVYRCHGNRVKEVEVEPMEPHLFWSASEDGTVRQFDTRVAHSQQTDIRSANVLVNVRAAGNGEQRVPIKTLAINPLRPYELATGCEDPYVRVFDRRMLRAVRPGTPSTATALCFAPAHLHLHPRQRKSAHCTFVSYASSGTQLVATYHGDGAYAFRTTGASESASDSAVSMGGAPSGGAWGGKAVEPWKMDSSAKTGNERWSRRRWSRGPAGDELREEDEGCLWEGCPREYTAFYNEASNAAQQRMMSKAIRLYTKAIEGIPGHPVILSNRAAAYLYRNWPGDAVAALADAEEAIENSPDFFRPYLRRAHALRSLGLLSSAKQCLDEILERFPERREEMSELVSETENAIEGARKRAADREQRLESLAARLRGRLRRQSTDVRTSGGDDAAHTRAQGAGQGASGQGASHRVGEEAGGGRGEGERQGDGEGNDTAEEVGQEHRRHMGTLGDERPTGRASGSENGSGSGSGSGSDRESGDGERSGRGSESGNESGSESGSEWGTEEDEESEEIVLDVVPVAEEEGGDEEGEGEEEREGSRRRRLLGNRLAEMMMGQQSDEASRNWWEEGLRDELGVLRRPNVKAGALDGYIALTDDSPPRQLGEPPGPWDHCAGGVPNPRGKGLTWRWVRDMSAGQKAMRQRYTGHRNEHTDIKEAVFLGRDDSLVACCSDDGYLYIYEAVTGQLIVALHADDDIVNCCQAHPSEPVFATSGIEDVVRIWAPRPDVEPEFPAVVVEEATLDKMMSRNQSARAARSIGINPLLMGLLEQRIDAAVEADSEGGGMAVQCPVQ